MDRTSGVTSCVSVASNGTPGNAGSEGPALSADGARVAFESVATNLSANCQSGVPQIFVRDRLAGTTRCVSVTPDGLPGDAASINAAISGAGSVIAFSTTAANLLGGTGGAALAGLAAVERQAIPGLAATSVATGALRSSRRGRLTRGRRGPAGGRSGRRRRAGGPRLRGRGRRS